MKAQQYKAQAGITIIPGTRVAITVPVTYNGTDPQCTAKVTCYVYVGQLLSGHGKLIETIVGVDQVYAPGETKNLQFFHTTTLESDARRDVGFAIDYWDKNTGATKSGPISSGSERDDVFYVQPVTYSFAIDQPVVAQA